MKNPVLNSFLSLLLILWIVPAYAQEEDKKPVGNEVYEAFKAEGIEKAIETYHDLKKKNAEEYLFDELQLNIIGYKIMNEDNDPQAAKKIFWLNLQEYPYAVNPNDSYADVLVRLGEKDEAKEYYKKAIATYEKRGTFERNVARNANGKLAVLDKKHKDLGFLEGSWSSNSTFWNEQNEENNEKEEVSFKYYNDIVLVGEMKYETRYNDEIPGPVWVITYNAQDNIYETSWIGPNLRGLMDSKLKMEKREGNNYHFMEEFEVDDEEYNIRHEIEANGNNVKWTTYESKNGQDFRKVAMHDMTKK